jgi:hypothetical protein
MVGGGVGREKYENYRKRIEDNNENIRGKNASFYHYCDNTRVGLRVVLAKHTKHTHTHIYSHKRESVCANFVTKIGTRQQK